jgi:hypothetical protein
MKVPIYNEDDEDGPEFCEYREISGFNQIAEFLEWKTRKTDLDFNVADFSFEVQHNSGVIYDLEPYASIASTRKSYLYPGSRVKVEIDSAHDMQ